MTENKVEVIQAVGDAIQPAVWKNRKAYSWFVTVCLLGIYVFALWTERDLNLVTWLLFTLILLVMLGPTAEQFGKWLAQVSAIRSGTKFEEPK